ncbi:hypothetical protein VNI00_009301 [Paramarasmius palmivorus]|uniref:CHCH domain protein n=1 Tax=Paramarasmius palmivorus TaxID=297713 RepID=A0AAW0CSI7_9AGAR
MPRQSRGRSSAPARSAPAPAPAQTRSAHTAAAPAHAAPAHNPAAAHAPAPPAAATQTREPGMLAQMAATAGSVAVGSTIGHGISHMLFGSGGGGQAQEAQQAAPPVQHQAPAQQGSGISCDTQAKDFTRCLEKADMQSCTWYLEQLKACQAAAAPY